MMIFKKALPRRAFLRGAGATIALPFLDAMVPAFAASGNAAQPPLRLGYIYLPVGRIMDSWTPKTVGREYEMTPSLKPISPFREQMLVLSGMDIKAADLLPGERGGTHARPCAAYLTGVHPYDNSVGISVDQVVAKHIGHETQLSSMQLGLDPAEWAGGNEVDYDGFYRSTNSWLSATTPLPTQNNPRKVFERMFGDTDSLEPEAVRRRIQEKGSVLDSVSGRVNRLMASVNAGDRYKLEEYLDAVRDIERGIQAAESRTASANDALNGMRRPTGIPEDLMEHSRLMFDLMFLAYKTDMTRVIAFMLGHEGTNRNYLELGAQDGHHSLSHHKGNSEAIDLLRKVDDYQSRMVAYFMERMQSAREADGSSLLDNSIIIAGSALSDGNGHVHNNIPLLIFGGAQGKVRGGRHVRHDGVPFSNLHLAVIDMFDAPSKEFLSGETSDATGILKGLA